MAGRRMTWGNVQEGDPCPNCGKPILFMRRTKRYCSDECRGEYKRKVDTIMIASLRIREILRHHPELNGTFEEAFGWTLKGDVFNDDYQR